MRDAAAAFFLVCPPPPVRTTKLTKIAWNILSNLFHQNARRCTNIYMCMTCIRGVRMRFQLLDYEIGYK